MTNDFFMNEAFKEAEKSLQIGEIPIGAIVVKNNKIIGKGHNLRQTTNAISQHAEINAIEEAGQKLNAWNLSDCILYTTLEPCLMCYSAIVQSRISEVYIACRGNDKKSYKFSNYIKIPENFHFIDFEQRSQKLLQTFFKDKR